ncbi:MAG: DUF790 family protein [Polyangiaceae bacterium]
MPSAEDLAFVLRDEAIVPRYLTLRDDVWLRLLISDVDAFVGRPVGALEAALPEREAHIAAQHGIAPRVVRGARKVLLGLHPVAVEAAVRPRQARSVAFALAAARGPRERDAALAAAAEELAVSPAEVEAGLFADLPAMRCLRPAPVALEPRAVAELYNLRLVQQILGRAQRVRVEVREHVRSVVRYAKLLRLICTYQLGPRSTAIELSGPLSILRQTTKYGRAFASFIPCVLSTPGWGIEAHGEDNGRRTRFVATAADPIGGRHALPRDADSSVERALVRDFRRLGSGWTLARETAAIALPGGGVFFPDFAVSQGSRRALVELIGFYTPEYLRAKLRALEGVRGVPVVVIIDDSLACADGDIAAARVVRYRRRVDAAALLAAVESAVPG